ncbi:MAG TPA: hypothetical protein VN381_09970 [Anaerovoracaceae bacterium]|nr:hypothetical protein [Anaerovoracaceae bacterium]
MKRKLANAVLGLAVTALAGAAVIGANGYFTASALAADNHREAPVITADTAEPGLAATVVVDEDGRQALVRNEALSAEDQARMEKDLALKKKAVKDSAPTFIAGTPSENDLPEAEAIEIAKSSVVEKFALTDETLSRFTIFATLNVVNPDRPEWQIVFNPTDQNDFSEIGTYCIYVMSPSGEVVKILSAADGVG